MAVIPASANAAATRHALRMRSILDACLARQAPGIGVAVTGNRPSAARHDQSLHLIAVDVRGGREPLREQARCRRLASARVAADDPDLGTLGWLTGRSGSHPPSLTKPRETYGDTRPHSGLGRDRG